MMDFLSQETFNQWWGQSSLGADNTTDSSPMSEQGARPKAQRKENQSSIHLTGEIRWFVLAQWENPANMHLKVLARHLHPMTYPGHRTGVTTGSSTQPGESVQLLTPRNGMNHCGQKQRRSHRCHTGMHQMQISNCC